MTVSSSENLASIPPAILCLGNSGAGKSTLLRSLEFRDDPKSAKDTVPTVGTNLTVICRHRKTGKETNVANPTVVVREIGGSMVQLWSAYIEPGKTKGIIYVVDASRPETLGRSTIHLLEFLNSPTLTEDVHVLIIFSKTDLKSSRTLLEFKFIMRLNHIIASSKRPMSDMSFNIETQENLEEILEWCMKFAYTG